MATKRVPYLFMEYYLDRQNRRDDAKVSLEGSQQKGPYNPEYLQEENLEIRGYGRQSIKKLTEIFADEIAQCLVPLFGFELNRLWEQFQTSYRQQGDYGKLIAHEFIKLACRDPELRDDPDFAIVHQVENPEVLASLLLEQLEQAKDEKRRQWMWQRLLSSRTKFYREILARRRKDIAQFQNSIRNGILRLFDDPTHPLSKIEGDKGVIELKIDEPYVIATDPLQVMTNTGALGWYNHPANVILFPCIEDGFDVGGRHILSHETAHSIAGRTIVKTAPHTFELDRIGLRNLNSTRTYPWLDEVLAERLGVDGLHYPYEGKAATMKTFTTYAKFYEILTQKVPPEYFWTAFLKDHHGPEFFPPATSQLEQAVDKAYGCTDLLSRIEESVARHGSEKTYEDFRWWHGAR